MEGGRNTADERLPDLEGSAPDSGEPFLCCLGGSSIAKYRSPMSDTDYFVIAAKDEVPRIVHRHCRSGKGSQDKPDIEKRDLDWFATFLADLDGFGVSLSGGPSGFNFWDLRFAVRILLGRKIAGSQPLLAALEARRDTLRRALASFYSSFLIATYEDAYGLCLAERYRELPVIAGELAQRAALLALLQDNLVDASPKWAFAMAMSGDYPLLQAQSSALLSHLGASLEPQPKLWALDLLRKVNSLVATAMLRDAAPCPEDMLSANAANLPLMDLSSPVPYCVMGVPGYKTVMDLRSNKVHLCNDIFLAMVRRGDFLPLS